MKFLLAVTASLTLAASPAGAHITHKVNRYEVLEHKCTQSHPKACIEYAIFVKRIPTWRPWLYNTAYRESRFVPKARNSIAIGNSHASGLFQILYPSTWGTTPYWFRWPFSAKWNALAAAWMVKHGRACEWSC